MPDFQSDLKHVSIEGHSPPEDAALDRYCMLKTGKYSGGKPEPVLIAEKAPVENDNYRSVIARGSRYWESWEKVIPAK